jgi:putative heme-binding domain-containing protein
VVTTGAEPRDDWFTPVDIQLGPDGALYIADFYKVQANHYRSSQGQTDPSLGRIYRLAGRETSPAQAFDLGAMSSEELVSQYLGHPNRWYREQTLRLLGDRRDRTLVPLLSRMVRENAGQIALDSLWALNLSGGFDDTFALEAMTHHEPYVRAWAVRLIGDNNAAPTATASALASLAQSEQDSGVRSQLACTAKRLPSDEALPIIVNLLSHDEDAGDLHIPYMLWWALEAHAGDREAVLRMCEEQSVWQSKLLPGGRTLQENLMQRWAMPGTQEDLLACARLLNLSPDAEHSKRLVAAFNRAFEGRPIPALPEPLAEALAKSGGSFATLLGIRRGNAQAITAGLATIGDPKATVADRLQLIRAIGDVQADPGQSVPRLLHIATTAGEDTLRCGALAALQKFQDASIGPTVLHAYNTLPPTAQDAAQSLLSSRAAWALQLMQAIDAGDVKPRTLQPGTIDKLRLQTDPSIVKLVGRFFPDTRGTEGELNDKIARFKKTILAGGGNPLRGKALFFGKVGCANCHTVFDHGGHVGPDLTSYDRSNLDSMLLAIVNPSAEIREGFEDYIITTKDGRTLDGFKVDENDKVFILRGIDGQNTVIPLDQLKSRRVSPRSIMPEGLLDDLQEHELCDLFSFLSSTTPPK